MKVEFHDGTLRYAPRAQHRDVLWLGSGFAACVSCGTLPLMGNYFDQLSESIAPALFGFLRQQYGSPRTANVEKALCLLEQIQELPPSAAQGAGGLTLANAELARRELGAYSIFRLSCWNRSPCHWGAKFMRTVDERTDVVTTNYDLCAETMLNYRPDVKHASQSTEFNCHVCQTNAIVAHGCGCGEDPAPDPEDQHAALYKLHGSISWRTCRNAPCTNVNCLVPKHRMKTDLCECCGGATEPVLVLPSMTKRCGMYPDLERMWRGMLASIRSAERLIVFGFSFTETDSGLGAAVRGAIRGAASLREIIVIDVNPAPVAARVREMAGSGAVAVREFAVPRDGSIPAWWMHQPQELNRYRVPAGRWITSIPTR